MEQSLAIQQQIGDRKGEGVTLNNIAGTAHAKGDYDSALRYLEQSLAIQRQIGDIHNMTTTLHNMGSIPFERNDFEGAAYYFIQAHQISHQIGSPIEKVVEEYLSAIINRIGEAKFQEILSQLNQE